MRLLIVSDSPAIQSGQGRVVRELARRFKQDSHEVVVAGWFHGLAPGSPGFPYPVIPASKPHPESVAPIINEIKPDTVLGIGDPSDFVWLARVKGEGAAFRLAGYLNIDGAPFPSHLEGTLDAFDVLTTTSEWGAQVIGRPGVVGIHHGVDRSVFYPTPKPETLLGMPVGSMFVVLLNGQNTQRKNFAVAIQGFARFAADKRDVLCYANTQTVPKLGGPDGQDLGAIVVELGLQRTVLFNPRNRGPLDTVGDRAVNAYYGLADVLLVTSTGEGFCLPILEAMATKTVPVATEWCSMPELLDNGRGELIPVAARFRTPIGNDHAVLSPDDVAVALERVYTAWRDGKLAQYHEPGLKFAAARPWSRTYDRLSRALQAPRAPAIATGKPIDSYLRVTARRAAMRHRDAVAVLKLGGLGDMLQTTTVVRAAAAKYQRPVVVFCNNHPEVFSTIPDVVDVVNLASQPQDQALRSIGDLFPIVLDVRYVSWAYGTEPTEFAVRHRWLYQRGVDAASRLGQLGRHSTQLMLESLGLLPYAPHADGRLAIQPWFFPRAPVEGLPGRYLAVATGVGGLGTLKQPSMDYFRSILSGVDVPLVQIGGDEDPEVQATTLDARDASLAETATILEKAAGLLAVESGMAHLAAAVGTKAVVVFGPTPVTLFGYPWNVNVSTMDCAPCWWGPNWGEQVCAVGASHCVNFPPSGDVASAVAKLLREGFDKCPRT